MWLACQSSILCSVFLCHAGHGRAGKICTVEPKRFADILVMGALDEARVETKSEVLHQGSSTRMPLPSFHLSAQSTALELVSRKGWVTSVAKAAAVSTKRDSRTSDTLGYKTDQKRRAQVVFT